MPANQLFRFLQPLARSRVPKCTRPRSAPGKSKDRLSPDESFIGGQKWKSRFDDRQMEADRIHVAEGNRVPHLTDTDRIVIDEYSLSIQKASILKSYWANGYSSPEAATALNAQRGFSRRTIDDYWAAFYEAERRDTGKEE